MLNPRPLEFNPATFCYSTLYVQHSIRNQMIDEMSLSVELLVFGPEGSHAFLAIWILLFWHVKVKYERV